MNINLLDEALNELDQKYIDRAAKSFRAESGRSTVIELTAVEPPTDIEFIKKAKKPRSTAFRVMTAAASIAAAFAVVIGSVFVIDRFRTDVLEKGAGAATSDIRGDEIPTVSASDFIGGHEPVDPMVFVKTDTVESIGVLVYPDPRGGRWYSEGFTHDGEGSSGRWAISVFNEDGSFEATYVSEKTFDGYLEASKTYVPCFTDKGFAMTEYRYDDDLGQYSTTVTFYDDDFNAVREYSYNYDNAKDMGGTALSQNCEYMLTVCVDRIVINKLMNSDGQVTAVYSMPRGKTPDGTANTVMAPVLSSDGKSLLFIDSKNLDNGNSLSFVRRVNFSEDGNTTSYSIDDNPPQNPIDDYIGYGQCITLSRDDSVYAYGLDFNASAFIDLGENERVKHFHASPKAKYFIAVIRNTVTDAHRIEVFKLDNGALTSVKRFDVPADIVMHDQEHGIACVNDMGTVFVLGPTGISRTFTLDYDPSAYQSEYESDYQYELEEIDLQAPAVSFTRSDTPYISDDAVIEIDPYSGNTIVRTNTKSGGRMVFSVFDSTGNFIKTYMSEKTVSEYAVEDRIDCGPAFTESGFMLLKHHINSDGKINAFSIARYGSDFELAGETLMQTIPAEKSYYMAECSANGKYLLTIRDGMLNVYDTSDGEALRSLDLNEAVETDDGRTVTLSSFVHPMISNDGNMVNVIARTNENESVMTYIDLDNETVNAFAYDFLDNLKGISGGSSNFACYTDDSVAKFGFKGNTMNWLGDNDVDARVNQEGEQVGFMQKADNEVVKYFTISPNGKFYLIVLHNNDTNIDTAKVYKCIDAMPVLADCYETYPKSSYNINDLGSVFCVGSRKLSSVHLKATGQPWPYGDTEKAINDVTNDFTYDDAYMSGSAVDNELWDYLEREKELMSQLEAENERLEKDKELVAENERLKRESELLSEQHVSADNYPVIGKIFDVPCEVTMPFGVNGYDAICISPESHEGTPIHTIMSGRVIYADWGDAENGEAGYGKYVLIDHGNGYWTRYSHCDELFVSAGDEVNEGDVIASVGATGFITGPCLRFELIFNGENVDPADYVVR